MSTVANHLVGHDPLSPDEPPFGVSLTCWDSRTTEVKHETVEFMWENNLYQVTIVDTPGLFDTVPVSHHYFFNEIEKYIKQHVMRIDLILFVCRKTLFSMEALSSFHALFLFIRKKLCRDFSPISALAVTGCDSHDERQDFVRHFYLSQSLREIASQMGMGVYPVGFPPLQQLPPHLQLDYKQQMMKDRDTLRGLIVRVNAERERGE